MIAVGPRQSGPVLVSADAIGLRPIVRASQQRSIPRQVERRSRRLQAGYPFESRDACLGNDVLAVETAGIHKHEITSIVIISNFASNRRREDVHVAQARVLRAAMQR